MLVASEVGAEQEAGLHLETGSPDALCPELAITRDAVQRRLGELIVPSGPGWTARYTIGHAPEGASRDFVRLELFGPEGTLKLSRDLPLEGESCSTMADVIALILDRYFRALSATESAGVRSLQNPPEAAATGDGGLPLPPAHPPEPPPALVEPIARDMTLLEEAGDSVTSAMRLRAFGAELAAHHPERPAAGVRGLFEVWPDGYVGAALLVDLRPDTERLAEGGEVSTQGFNVRSYLGWGPRFGAVRTYLGPGLRLLVERGSGRGFPEQGQGYRAVCGAGADVGLLWAVSDSWQLTLSSAIDVALLELGGRFVVDGDEVLRPQLVKGWLGVGVAYAFAP